MGNVDRTSRLVGGVIIVAVGVYMQSWWGAVGLIPLATGSLKWCPLYLPFNFSTAEKKSD